MKLRWSWKKITTPDEIESHNNMVETLWRWRHAGLVIETEGDERLPELIDAPKRIVKCECGNDDLHSFTLYSLNDIGRYSLCGYGESGKIDTSYDETDIMPADIALELGIARKATPGRHEDGTEYVRYEWLWAISCDKCRKHEKIWSSDLEDIVYFT